MFFDSMVDCSFKKNTHTKINMPRQTKSEGQKMLDKFLKAAKSAPKETPEQKAEREKKRAIQDAKYAASNAAFMAAYRAAHPVQEIATGSPYQEAREAWVNGQPGTDGVFDHWTSNK
jgi:formiminotetrahydrofolate cyclodeaminase